MSLIARYTFDDGTAADSSGNGHNGTLVNAPTMVPGHESNALQFVSADIQSVAAPHITELENATAFTISVWMAQTVSGGSKVSVLQGSPDDYVSIEFWNNGIVYFEIYVTGSFYSAYEVSLGSSALRHFAFTFDGSQVGDENRLKAYVDGEPVSGGPLYDSVPSQIGLCPGNFLIGKYFNDYSDGIADDVRVYDTAFSAEEVAQLFRGMGTIGTLNFAWADKTETTFGPEHHVKNLIITNFTLDHAENSFAAVKVDVKNPRAGGLLAPARKRYAWISEETSPGVFEPLFFGRLKGWPDDLSGEVITLALDGKPADFKAQQAALAETLMTLPEVDPVMIDADKLFDPDTVLIARSANWHADRVTGVVTISDWIVGEDGLETFASNEVTYVSVKPSRGAAPLKSIDVNATVRWKRTNNSTIDMGTKEFTGYACDGIVSDWWKPGGTIGGSYTVATSNVEDLFSIADAPTATFGFEYHNQQKTHENGDTLSESYHVTQPVLIGPFLKCVLVDNVVVGLNDQFADPPINIAASRQTNDVSIPLWKIRCSMTLNVGADIDYVERLTFTLPLHLQELDTDSEDAVTTDTIAIDGNDVGTVMPDGTTAGSMPIGSLDRNSYYLQPRGDQTIQHLLLRARAKGLATARCLTVSADIPWARARELSCRKNATIPDGRIPGGTATGKIVAYQLRLNPQTGEQMGNVTIACVPGFGATLVAVGGTPEYVDEGVLDPGIQFYTGSTILVGGTSDLAYSPPTQIPGDDGLTSPITRGQIVMAESTTGLTQAQQETALRAAFAVEIAIAKLQATPAMNAQTSIENQQKIILASKKNIAATLKTCVPTYHLELRDLSDGISTDFTIDTAPLEAPQQVNLESSI